MDRLDAMRAFVRLVEVGSFSAVGRELHVEQSTVSKWLAALEEELGVQLIRRTTRSQQVTDAGALFYDRAREMLAAYADVSAELSARSPVLRGRLRVGLPVVFGSRFVVPALSRFIRRHPELELELLLDDRYVDLVGDNLDLAVRVGTPVDSSLRTRTLGHSRRKLVASPGYLKRVGRPRRPQDLARHQCLLHSGLPTGATWTFERGGKRVRARVAGRLSANHSASLALLARGGHGVALLADWLVDEDLRAGRLVELLPAYGAPPAPIQALLPPGRHVHPRTRAVVEFLVDTLPVA